MLQPIPAENQVPTQNATQSPERRSVPDHEKHAMNATAQTVERTQFRDEDGRPSLARDVAFHGMTVTQFLGAFNDNLFKQLVLLLCVDLKLRSGQDYQPIALALFAVPFVLFSGFGGFLADLNSKRSIVVLCKIGEIVVMSLGLFVFFIQWPSAEIRLYCLFAVLFLMSMQSAFFGPAKYGILPELFRKGDLPAANGIIQMTTFLAIIFGMAIAGYSKDWLQGDLWMLSIFCVVVAVVGTFTSLLIRRTAIAHPGLKFEWEALGVNAETATMLKTDPPLLGVLLVSSLFWFVGGVVHPAVNEFGKLQLNLSDARTSMMAACMGIGIALGCVLAGRCSRHRIDFRLVTGGAWGITLALILLTILGLESQSAPDEETVNLWALMWPATNTEFLARLILTGLGVAAGFFVVPLQVFLQARPPADKKGRMIGTMNLVTWIGILLSAGFLQIALKIIAAADLKISWLFSILALVVLPIALGFHRWLRQYGDL